jgi:predicted N-acetyltransferase YhbS
MSDSPAVTLRPAQREDLPRINRVIDAAVMGWQLPERVKRLALPGYLYPELDLAHLMLVVAETANGDIVGVAASEPARPDDTPSHQAGLLLHGLYVHPHHQRQGIGRRLYEAVENQARQQGFAGLLVKAQADARAFFLSRGMQSFDTRDPGRDYPHRYWIALDESA